MEGVSEAGKFWREVIHGGAAGPPGEVLPCHTPGDYGLGSEAELIIIATFFFCSWPLTRPVSFKETFDQLLFFVYLQSGDCHHPVFFPESQKCNLITSTTLCIYGQLPFYTECKKRPYNFFLLCYFNLPPNCYKNNNIKICICHLFFRP